MKRLPSIFRLSFLSCCLIANAAAWVPAASAAEVNVVLQRSDDGTTWSPIPPGLEPVGASATAHFRATVTPSGGSPVATDVVTVTMPAGGGQVEVSVESSLDLLAWEASTTGNQTLSPKEFYRVHAIPLSQVPAITFSMGDSWDGMSDASPVHTVTLSPYYIQQTEVTKEQWDVVAAWAAAAANGYDISPAGGGGKGPNHPVHSITWYEAIKYANACSERAGLTPVYTYTVGGAVYKTGNTDPDINYAADGYRLPTEAEWECAARGGLAGKRFPWGDTISHVEANYKAIPGSPVYDVSATVGFHPDWDTDPLPYTSPVGTFAPNAYGQYDMTGNVLEWCADFYWEDYYGTVDASGDDPTGPDTPQSVWGNVRVIRGGSYGESASGSGIAVRAFDDPIPTSFTTSLGFRLARRIAVEPPPVESTASRSPQNGKKSSRRI